MTISKTDLAGWYGAIAIVLAYTLTSFHSIAAGGWIYLLLNLTGSVGLLWISLIKRVWQNVSINAVWLVVAAVGLVMDFRQLHP